MLYVQANPQHHTVNAYPDTTLDPHDQYDTLATYQAYLRDCWPGWHIIIVPTWKARPTEAQGNWDLPTPPPRHAET
jgi:hypothetical protein